jgi:hypothetical protein
MIVLHVSEEFTAKIQQLLKIALDLEIRCLPSLYDGRSEVDSHLAARDATNY